MHRPARLLTVTAALALGVVLVAACGVPLDGEPRAISVSTTTTSTTLGPSDDPGAQRVSLYFLDEDHLVVQPFAVEGEADLKTALGLVLSTKPDPPLQNRIPPGTTLGKVSVDEGAEAHIDLSAEIEDVSGQTQKEAYAQIVFTALEFNDVESVSFSVDGQPRDAPTDHGNLSVVTANDYDPPLNPR